MRACVREIGVGGGTPWGGYAPPYYYYSTVASACEHLTFGVGGQAFSGPATPRMSAMPWYRYRYRYRVWAILWESPTPLPLGTSVPNSSPWDSICVPVEVTNGTKRWWQRMVNRP